MKQLRTILLSILLVCAGMLFALPVQADDVPAGTEENAGTVTEENTAPDPDTINFTNKKYTGVAKSPKNGLWYRVKKGKIDKKFSGFAQRPEDEQWYYVQKGKVNSTYTGVEKDPASGKWLRVKNGIWEQTYTGIAKRPQDGKWYYIKNGEWMPNFKGVAKRPETKKWYYIRNGIIDWKYSGVAKRPGTSKWYRVHKGRVNLKFTGRAKRPENGTWYYIKNGKWDKKFTGFYKKNGKKMYFVKGKQVFGWAKVGKKYYYLNEKTGVLEMKAKSTSVGFLCSPASGKTNGKTIVLDPGHASYIPSGSEPIGPGSGVYKAKDTYGARGVSTGITEAALNLTIAQQLRAELIGRGYKVALTRETGDVAISCVERTNVANTLKASAYIRIHADSSGGSARGAQTICVSNNSPYRNTKYSASDKLSRYVLDTYCKTTGIANRGVWYTDTMTGNNWSNVPTTLIEMGFLSNTAEDIWMNTPANQAVMVKGIADGIDAYFAK